VDIKLAFPRPSTPLTMTSIERATLPLVHDKTQSQTIANRRPSKGLTLSFPVLQPTSQSDRQQLPSPKHITPADSTRSSPRILTIATSPSDSIAFLTFLAAQERLVLELREELHKAEADLSRLKRQWAQYEAGRKKNELRHVERLQSLPDTHPVVMDGYNDYEVTPAAALRASLENGTDRPVVRKSTQRVFSGSRHTRALSLLSPGAMSNQSVQSRPFEQVLSPTVTTTDIHSKQPPLSRSSTLSSAEQNVGFGRTYKQLAGRRSMPPPAKDAIVNSGKKMASDLREGLWTFFEDIRQATVGEEGIDGMETRVAGPGRGQRQGPRRLHVSEQERTATRISDDRRVERQNGRLSTIRFKGSSTSPRKAESFWDEFGLENHSNKNTDIISADKESKPEPNTSLVDADDSWDIWDSPIPPQLSSKHGESVVAKSRTGSDGLPWPELKKLTPSKLSRTVSDLMKEWESPPVASRTKPAGLEDQAVASPQM
jgi:Domain of unknown function (DUF4048)